MYYQCACQGILSMVRTLSAFPHELHMTVLMAVGKSSRVSRICSNRRFCSTALLRSPASLLIMSAHNPARRRSSFVPGLTYVPVIDLTELHDENLRGEVVKQIGDALSQVGFVCITGHGISPDVLSGIQVAARAFFDLADSEKMVLAKKFFKPENANMYKGYFPIQNAPGHSSLKEGFDLGFGHDSEAATSNKPSAMFYEDNVWPSTASLPEFSEECLLYAQKMQRLGKTLLHAIAVYLELDRAFFDQMFDNSLSTLRFLHYPENKNPSALSCSEHTDSGALTLLLQDDVGGLQVEDKMGIWRDVVPVKDSFVINTGDLFEKWTGGKFKATMHRVLGTKAERYSIPFFFEPNGDARITCVPTCSTASGDNSEVVYEEYLFEKIKKFDEYKLK